MARKFYCWKNKCDIDYALFDRLLEGVMFKCKPIEGEWIVEIHEGSESYFNDLNTTKWLAAVKESCEDISDYEGSPEYAEVLQCPQCHSGCVYVEEEEAVRYYE
jgi:hypothetical protein